MAELKDINFIGPDGTAVRDAELTEDYNSAEKAGSVRVGIKGVYFRSGLKYRYILLDDIDRAFRRIEAVSAKMCCSRASFDIHSLVLCDKGGELCDLRQDEERHVTRLLELISQRRPEIHIGVKKD